MPTIKLGDLAIGSQYSVKQASDTRTVIITLLPGGKVRVLDMVLDIRTMGSWIMAQGYDRIYLNGEWHRLTV